MTAITSEHPTPDGSKPDWLEVVRQNVAALRFGSFQITVHDGRVTQVVSIEKTRFVAPRDEGGPGQNNSRRPAPAIHPPTAHPGALLKHTAKAHRITGR